MRLLGLVAVFYLIHDIQTHVGNITKIQETNFKTDFMALRTSLFSNFSVDFRPVLNKSEPVTVNVSLFIFNVHALNEREQKLTISAWFYLEWIDAFLRWNPSDYNGLSEIIVSKKDVWTPDLKIFNGYEGLVDISDYGNLVRLSSTGEVIFEPGSAFELYCLVDITYYPFDQQECSMVIMFWMSRIFEADMIFSNKDYVFRALRPNGEWDIEFRGAKHYAQGFSDDTNRRYAYLEYSFRLSRKRTFYVLHYLIPVTLLSMLNAIVFILPPESGEKMSLSITVLLSFTLFISLLNSSLPQTSLHVSLFAVYLSVLLGIGTISVILSAIGLYLHYRNEDNLPEPVILSRSASVRRALFKQRTMQESSKGSQVDPEMSVREAEYSGLLSKQQTGKRDSLRMSLQGNGFVKEEIDNRRSTSRHSSNTNGQPNRHFSGNSKPNTKFWCINPNLFDRIGFYLCLFLSLGSTLTIITMLASH